MTKSPTATSKAPGKPAGRKTKAGARSASTQPAGGPSTKIKSAGKPKGKITTLVELLRRPDGATVEVMMAATGWQAHSVRGALSGAIKKGLGLSIASDKTDAGRVYRITDEAAA